MKDEQTVEMKDQMKAMFIESCDNAIKRADALQRLEGNEDFKLVITEGYLQENAVRLAHLLGDHTCNMGAGSENSRRIVTEQLTAIGRLAEFFRVIILQGQSAQKELDQIYSEDVE